LVYLDGLLDDFSLLRFRIPTWNVGGLKCRK
jgi:hypothetical protein